MSRWKLGIYRMSPIIDVDGDRMKLEYDVYIRVHRWRIISTCIEIMIVTTLIILEIALSQIKIPIVLVLLVGVFAVDYLVTCLLLPKDISNHLIPAEMQYTVLQRR